MSALETLALCYVVDNTKVCAGFSTPEKPRLIRIKTLSQYVARSIGLNSWSITFFGNLKNYGASERNHGQSALWRMNI